MLVAQISDTHILARASDHPAATLRAECLRRCIADINRQGTDAVIFTGDTVQYGQPEEYAHLRELLAPLDAPLYLVPGNRDNNAAPDRTDCRQQRACSETVGPDALT
jgi:3',5'-cyclic AMP phosphodiesterase CpdA